MVSSTTLAASGLVPRVTLGSVDLTAAPYALRWGTDIGAPENVYGVLESRLFDGEVVSSTRSSNRQITLPVLIEGPTMAALAQAEAALALECDRARNTLAIDPGDGFGRPTVFDTFRAQLTFQRADANERAFIRLYDLTIPALPFGRSADQVTDTVQGVSGTGTAVASWDTTTGWSGTSLGGFVADTDAADRVEGTASVRAGATSTETTTTSPVYYGFRANHLHTLASPLATGAGGLLTFAHRQDSTVRYYATSDPIGVGTVTVTYSDASTTTATASALAALSNGFTRYGIAVTAGKTITSVRIQSLQQAATFTGDGPRFYYDDLRFIATGSALSKQAIGTIAVRGSVRSPGSIRVASATAALGQVLVLTTDSSAQPPTFNPALRFAGYQTAGTNTADAATLGGTRVPIGTTFGGAGNLQADVPLSTLTPGSFEVWLRVTNTTATTFAAQAQLVVGGTTVGSLNTTEGDTYATSATFRWVSAGYIQLPPQAMPIVDSTALVRLLFRGPTGGTMTVDEVVLAPASGAITIIDCGTGTLSSSGASSHLWIDAPTVTSPVGGWFRGTSADRLNARSAIPDATALGRHVFAPPTMRVYIATAATDTATTALTYFPAYHTNAGED